MRPPSPDSFRLPSRRKAFQLHLRFPITQKVGSHLWVPPRGCQAGPKAQEADTTGLSISPPFTFYPDPSKKIQLVFYLSLGRRWTMFPLVSRSRHSLAKFLRSSPVCARRAIHASPSRRGGIFRNADGRWSTSIRTIGTFTLREIFAILGGLLASEYTTKCI